MGLQSHQVAVYIHRGRRAGERIPNSSTLEFCAEAISLDVVKGKLSFRMGASRQTAIKLWLDFQKVVRTNSQVQPADLMPHAKYLRSELLELLTKLKSPTSSIEVDYQNTVPSAAKRKQLIAELNPGLLLQFCQLLELPIKQLPVPLYRKCMLASL